MVSKGPRPWGRGRSELAAITLCCAALCADVLQAYAARAQSAAQQRAAPPEGPQGADALHLAPTAEEPSAKRRAKQ